MPESSASEYRRCPAADLRDFAARCFAAAGMPAGDAALAAGLLVRAEARGVETHGLQWLPSYCRSLRAGRMNPTPRIAVTADTGALLAIDGDGGLGHVVSARAMRLCIERAREQGLAAASVRNSRHNGAASLYALLAAEAGMIGLSLTGGGVRVAPAGGREALLGTNPIAFAAPAAAGPPFVLDAATSVVAGARVQAYADRGLPLPPGWALDPEGHPTTDAALGARGPLLPLGGLPVTGGHKGFGLGLMVEVLCHALAGMATGPERARGAEGGGTGHFFLALRVGGHADPEEFAARLQHTLEILRDSAPMEGTARVMTPGEPEWHREQAAATAGVPLHRQARAALSALAEELQVRFPQSWNCSE